MPHPDVASSPLITAAELAGRLGECTVLDVRYRLGGPTGRGEYAAGHVPGAVYVDLDADLAAAPGAGGRHPLPSAEHFEAAMRAAGVRAGLPVVVYDDWGGRAAARCWWLLRYHGHTDVRLLDGGWTAWRGGEGEVELGEPAPPPRGDFTAVPGAMTTLAAEEVAGFLEEGTLVDARAPERFRGEVEPIDPVAGHIPGAINVPTEANLDEDGTFRPAAELRVVYAAATAGPVAAYCGSGVTAAHDIVAMAVAGIDAALYPGSWSEWVHPSSAGRPVALGE